MSDTEHIASEDADLSEAETGVETLNSHIGRMDEGELLLIAGELEELLTHPGWQRLGMLLAIQERAISDGASRRLWAHFRAGHTLREQAPYIRLGGVMEGLGRPQRIIRHVLTVADLVKAKQKNGEA